VTDLETRIRVLEDIEAIKKLQSRYWRYIIKGLPDEVADCFTEDGVGEFTHNFKAKGRKALAQFYREIMFQNLSIRAPQGHNPEIDIIDDKNATGVWFIDMASVNAQTKKAARIGALYEDIYVKEKGQWKIKYKKTNFIYQQKVEMEDMPQSSK
jgi:hypothetical protein